MAGAARLRGRARRAHLRRHADLRRARTAPTTAPIRSSSRQGAVAGVPPDAFATTGQLWGNPLYDWTAMRADGYRWWIERFRRTFDLVDLTRVDHFRGFVSYWAVPEGRADRGARPLAARARRRACFERRRARSSAPLAVVAEDLGVITEPVVRLRRELGFPGMASCSSPSAATRRNPHLPAEPRRSSRSSTRARTTTTRRSAGGSRCPTPTARGRGSTRPIRRGR